MCENNVNEKFWMLKALNGGNPTFVHKEYDIALNEAKKLSGILNDKIYILEAVQVVEVNIRDLSKKDIIKTEEIMEIDDDIPPF